MNLALLFPYGDYQEELQDDAGGIFDTQCGVRQLMVKKSNAVGITALGDAPCAPSGSQSDTGAVVMTGKAVVAWESQRQATAVASAGEAEWMAQGITVNMAGAVEDVLTGLGVDSNLVLRCDHRSALRVLAACMSRGGVGTTLSRRRASESAATFCRSRYTVDPVRSK